MKTPGEDRSGWTVKKCTSFEEMRTHKVRQWQKEPFMKRLDAAWDLVAEAWEIKNRDPSELRLQRMVATVVRRES